MRPAACILLLNSFTLAVTKNKILPLLKTIRNRVKFNLTSRTVNFYGIRSVRTPYFSNFHPFRNLNYKV